MKSHSFSIVVVGALLSLFAQGDLGSESGINTGQSTPIVVPDSSVTYKFTNVTSISVSADGSYAISGQGSSAGGLIGKVMKNPTVKVSKGTNGAASKACFALAQQMMTGASGSRLLEVTTYMVMYLNGDAAQPAVECSIRPIWTKN